MTDNDNGSVTVIFIIKFLLVIVSCLSGVRTAALGMLTLQRSEHQKSEGFDKQNLNRALTLTTPGRGSILKHY